MRVILAGYNVDAEVIEDLKKTSRPRQDVTPETLSAAYARISRDPRPIDELRKIAREEVEKARKSNQNIIFKMGHHSIAEHAVFNLDIIGVSRLALEEIEKFRLCAYTEKSQRYQKLEDDFVVPDEIRAAGCEKEFTEAIKKQNLFYHELVNKGVEPEDARYATSLAMEGQVGLTINARNLEFLFRRFASHQLSEIRLLGKEIYKLISNITPSIILFTEANDFDQHTYPGIKMALRAIKGKKVLKDKTALKAWTKNADDILVAALIHTSTQLDYDQCLKEAKKVSKKKRTELLEKCFQYAELYDRPLREFEYIDLTYEAVVSAACFGQLKRHRMATITVQPYDPELGVMIPESIIKTGAEKEFKQIVKLTDNVYKKIAKKDHRAAQYVLTNAHRRRVLIKVNARELYHISRLREDNHAQWDIRNLSRQITGQAKKVMPLTMLFIGGKDSYPQIYESHFGKRPKIEPQY